MADAQILQRPQKRREYLARRMYALEMERATWDSHWKAIADVVAPRRQRFFLGEANKGNKRNRDIVENSATLSLRTFAAGVMSDITNPGKPWFGYGIGDPYLERDDAVKEWVYQEEQETYEDLMRSPLYRVLPGIYEDWALYSTALMSIEEHFETVFHFRAYPVGSYVIDVDEYGAVDTVGVKFRQTVRQVVARFGRKRKDGSLDPSNLSGPVIWAYERGDLEQWVDVWRVVGPNEDYDPRIITAEAKEWKSCYFEGGLSSITSQPYGASDDGDKFLEESGFEYFPFLCARWKVVGEDIYGCDGPGMIAHGDVRQLQHIQRKILRGVGKMVDPNFVAPPEMKNLPATLESGKATFLNETGDKKLRVTHEVDPGIFTADQIQEQTRGRIRRAFYEDVMRAFLDDQRRQPPTATEIQERFKEKLFELSGPFQMLHSEFLRPLIEKVFLLRMRQGRVAPPPPQLQGMPLTVEYHSVLLQALKQVNVSSIDRFLLTAGQMAAADPSLMDVVDGDEVLRGVAKIYDVPPAFLRSQEEVAAIRDQRAQAVAAQQQQEAIAATAKAAKDLGETPMEGDTALTRIARAVGGGGGGAV